MNFNPTPPEPDFILCENCDSETYEGETAFVFNAKDLCEDCISAMDINEIVDYILEKED